MLRIIKFLGMSYLSIANAPLIMATRPRLSALQSCEPVAASDNGINFICGNLPQPFQPCPDFTVVAGKATTNTTLWILGESHIRKAQTADCIDRLTDSVGEHRIHVESIAAGEKVDCSDAPFTKKPGRSCIGWDDREAYLKTLNLDTSGQNIRIREAITNNLNVLHELYVKDYAPDDTQYDEALRKLYPLHFKMRTMASVGFENYR